MYVACPRCHQQNYSTATQCAYCGSPLTAPAAPPGVPHGFASTNAPGFAAGPVTGGGAGPEVAGQASGQPQVGQLIDRKYKVERVLGEGGMGVVFVAHDVNADHKVVIKSIRPEFANRGDFRERTMAEGRALAKIDHQNVVRFYSIVNSPETGELYIVMQFIDGESLDRTLEKANAAGQKLPIPEIIRIFKMALDGVGAAHKEGMMHRDLKPANIIVRAKDGVAKVMDFGIAKAEGQTKGPTQAGGIVGSLWYMAPEQIKGAKDLDKRLDVYAMGIVLYELVTGVVPFDGETEYDIMTKHMSEPVPSVRLLRPDAPAWIDDLIAKATQKDRANRFQSCEEFRAAIDQLDGGLAVPRSMTAFENSIVPDNFGTTGGGRGGTAQMAAPGITGPTTGPTMAAPKKSSMPLVIGIVAILAVGGGIGGYFAFAHGDDGGGKTAQADKGDKGDKGDDKGDKGDKGDDKGDKGDKTNDQKDDGPKKPDKKDPLASLVGDWETDTTNRALKAVREGDEVVFRVVNVKEWDGAFAEDEVRFKLKAGSDDDTFEVVDRYRPVPGKGASYSKAALAGCIVESSGTVAGKPLQAVRKSDTSIEVSLATASVQLLYDPGDKSSVTGCKDAKTTGVVKATLKKK
ncbi:MAG: protein kinase [Deltaproteobacteria bacterium]|nr:protein kinase [Deltaproteobacteria bacterium]